MMAVLLMLQVQGTLSTLENYTTLLKIPQKFQLHTTQLEFSHCSERNHIYDTTRSSPCIDQITSKGSKRRYFVLAVLLNAPIASVLPLFKVSHSNTCNYSSM